MEPATRPRTRGVGHSGAVGRADNTAPTASRFIDLDLEANGGGAVDDGRSWLKFGPAPGVVRKPGTRPPIVGRETNPDPKWAKRYSEEDIDLQDYLQTLKLKANVESEPPAEFGLDSDQPTELTTKNRNYIKPRYNFPPPDAGNATSEFAFNSPKLVVNDRISSALTKVADLSSKYIRGPPRKPTKEETLVSHHEKRISTDGPATLPITKSDNRVNETAKLTVGKRNGKIRDSDEESTFDPSPESSLVASVESGEHVMNVRDLSELVFNEESRAATPSVADAGVARSRRSPPNTLKPCLHVESAGERSETNVDSESSDSLSSSISTKLSGRIRYSDDFESELEENSASTSSEIHGAIRDHSQGSVMIGSTDEPTPTVTPSSNARRRRGTASNKATQTVAVVMDSNAGLVATETDAKLANVKFMDPARVSRTVVSNEVIQGFSSYEPSVVAMNEMMRQHILSTRLFVESQRRAYLSSIYVLKPDYVYMTWADVEKSLTKRCSKPAS